MAGFSISSIVSSDQGRIATAGRGTTPNTRMNVQKIWTSARCSLKASRSQTWWRERWNTAARVGHRGAQARSYWRESTSRVAKSQNGSGSGRRLRFPQRKLRQQRSRWCQRKGLESLTKGSEKSSDTDSADTAGKSATVPVMPLAPTCQNPAPRSLNSKQCLQTLSP